MFFKKIYLFCAVLALLAAGCRTKDVEPFELPPNASPETIKARTAQLAATMQQTKLRGIVVRGSMADTLTDKKTREIIDNITSCGFNRVYIEIDTPRLTRNDKLKKFIADAADAKLRVELMLFQRNYVYHRVDSALRNWFVGHEVLAEAVKDFSDFNQSLPAGKRISGITVVMEVHTFTINNPNRPKDLLYSWSDKTYGIDNENDHVMRLAFAELREVKKQLDNLPLTVAIPDFYHEKAKEKQLSCGTVNDFLEIADKVIIVNSGNKAKEAVEAVDNELSDTGQAKKILVGVNLAEHTSVENGALRRRDWQDFCKISAYLNEKWGEYPSYGGIVIGPWILIDSLLKE